MHAVSQSWLRGQGEVGLTGRGEQVALEYCWLHTLGGSTLCDALKSPFAGTLERPVQTGACGGEDGRVGAGAVVEVLAGKMGSGEDSNRG